MLLNRKLLIAGGVVLVAVVIALAIILPLFVFNQKDETSDNKVVDTWIGSDVLDEVPLIDGHNDLPWTIYTLEKNQLANFNFDSNLTANPKWQIASSHTDLPKLRKGKLGGQFWVAYVACTTNYKDAVERTLEQIDVIKRLIMKHPKDMKFVTTADGIMEAFKEKKIASMIEIEGGHSIDSRLSVLRLFYELGVRCMTLTHTCNLPWIDASPIDDTTNVKKNLTTWGKGVIYEMNRLGMIVDISHVSEGVMLAVLEHSKAPVIFSHSSVFTLNNHHRNAKDNVLMKLKEKNGLIMINFYNGFIGGDNIMKVVEHIDYVRKLIGADHVGIGADFNGVSETPKGLEDTSKYPALFDILAESGHNHTAWTKEELKKLAGLNLIRVFKDVEKVRDALRDTKLYEENVPYEDIKLSNPDVGSCRTDIETFKPSAMIEKITVEDMIIN